MGDVRPYRSVGPVAEDRPGDERERAGGNRMRVLLTGTESCGIDRVERALEVEGHRVLSCWEPSSPGSCRAVSSRGECPATLGVDVIVVAREHPLPHLTARESLVGCAQLAEIPLVLTGSTAPNPYGDRAHALVSGFDGVVAAVRSVVGAPGVTG